MFVAQIHNKLSRSEENMEDLLTSNVFGIWLYLPRVLGLLKFLRTAERLDGTRIEIPEEVIHVELKFWSWMQERGAKGAEPDVLIEIKSRNQRRWLVLVEAKYLSGKSSFADQDELPNDQLAREMHNLRDMGRRRHFDEYALIYITAHTTMPRNDIEDAIKELRDKTGQGSAEYFYWTTWRRLPVVISAVRALCEEGGHAVMLDQLQQIIHRLGLEFFGGVTSEGWTIGESCWLFKVPEATFNWQPINTCHYNFEGLRKKFEWHLYSQPNQIWRFSYGKGR